MLHFLTVTRKCRRDMALSNDKKTTPTIILNRFPLLIHSNEAVIVKCYVLVFYFRSKMKYCQVQEEFEAITGISFSDIELKWTKVETLLLDEAERSLKSVVGKQLIKKANEAKDEFSKNIFRKQMLSFTILLQQRVIQEQLISQSMLQSYFYIQFQTITRRKWSKQ